METRGRGSAAGNITIIHEASPLLIRRHASMLVASHYWENLYGNGRDGVRHGIVSDNRSFLELSLSSWVLLFGTADDAKSPLRLIRGETISARTPHTRGPQFWTQVHTYFSAANRQNCQVFSLGQGRAGKEACGHQPAVLRSSLERHCRVLCNGTGQEWSSVIHGLANSHRGKEKGGKSNSNNIRAVIALIPWSQLTHGPSI